MPVADLFSILGCIAWLVCAAFATKGAFHWSRKMKHEAGIQRDLEKIMKAAAEHGGLSFRVSTKDGKAYVSRDEIDKTLGGD